jgi:hypothetical protein
MYSQLELFTDQLVADTLDCLNPDLRARWAVLILLLGPETQPLELAEKLRRCFNQNPGGDTAPGRFPTDRAGSLQAGCG